MVCWCVRFHALCVARHLYLCAHWHCNLPMDAGWYQEGGRDAHRPRLWPRSLPGRPNSNGLRLVVFWIWLASIWTHLCTQVRSTGLVDPNRPIYGAQVSIQPSTEPMRSGAFSLFGVREASRTREIPHFVPFLLLLTSCALLAAFSNRFAPTTIVSCVRFPACFRRCTSILTIVIVSTLLSLYWPTGKPNVRRNSRRRRLSSQRPSKIVFCVSVKSWTRCARSVIRRRKS